MTPLRWLVVATFVNRAGGGMRFLLVLYLTTARGFSPAAAGAVATGWGVGALVAQPVSGALADRAGRRAVMAGCMAGSAAVVVVLALARAPALIAACAVVAGLLNEGFRPALQAMVADLAAPEERVRAFGLVYWATNAGFTIAMAASGVLAAVGWGWVFALEATTSAAFAVIVATRLPETRPVASPDVARAGYGAALRDPLLLAVFLLQLAFGLMLLQCAATLPLAMAADGHGPAAYGAVMATAGLVVVVGQPLAVGPLSRPPRGLVYAAGLLVVGAGFAATAAAATIAGFAITAVVWSAGEIAVACVAGALVADLAPAPLRGRYMGVFQSAMPVAAVIAPAAGTAVLAGAGEPALWLGCGVLGAVAAAGALALGGRLRVRG